MTDAIIELPKSLLVINLFLMIAMMSVKVKPTVADTTYNPDFMEEDANYGDFLDLVNFNYEDFDDELPFCCQHVQQERSVSSPLCAEDVQSCQGMFRRRRWNGL
jgi:hypothetical protein